MRCALYESIMVVDSDETSMMDRVDKHGVRTQTPLTNDVQRWGHQMSGRAPATVKLVLARM
jgi:hypothetical protein